LFLRHSARRELDFRRVPKRFLERRANVVPELPAYGLEMAPETRQMKSTTNVLSVSMVDLDPIRPIEEPRCFRAGEEANRNALFGAVFFLCAAVFLYTYARYYNLPAELYVEAMLYPAITFGLIVAWGRSIRVWVGNDRVI
jgi:hypothetical protein